MGPLARATLEKLCISPLLYSTRDESSSIANYNLFLDYICGDFIVTLMNLTCEEEDDEGVASTAVQVMDTLVVSHTMGDELMTEIKDLLGRSVGEGSVSFKGHWYPTPNEGIVCWADVCTDYDSRVYASELAWRLLESALIPRLRKLLTRVLLFSNPRHQMICLPLMNCIVGHAYRTGLKRRKDGAIGSNNTRTAKERFAKRWYESDYPVLVSEYVNSLLSPLMEHSSSDVARGAAMCALRLVPLVHAKEGWGIPLLKSSSDIFTRLVKDYSSNVNLQWGEDLVFGMACALIAIRGLDLLDRVPTLETVLDAMIRLPSTQVIRGSTCALGLRLDDGTKRRPLRIGIWVEVALAILLPDPISTNWEECTKAQDRLDQRAKVLKGILGHPVIKTMLRSKSHSSSQSAAAAAARPNCILHPAEEIVVSFCSVAYLIGERLLPHVSVSQESSLSEEDFDPNSMFTSNSQHKEPHFVRNEGEEWLSSSLVLLQSFMGCLHWQPESYQEEIHNGSVEHASTLSHVAQSSYMELLKLVLISCGMLRSSCSMFMHFINPQVLKEEVDLINKDHFQVKTKYENVISLLLAKILSVSSEENKISSKELRLSLLTILSDSWIIRCSITIESNRGIRQDDGVQSDSGPVDIDEDVINLHERFVRVLLGAIANEISGVIEREKAKKLKDVSWNEGHILEIRYLRALISCVEAIACTSHLMTKHFSSSSGNADEEGIATYIVSVCKLVLKGQGKIEIDDIEGASSSEDLHSKSLGIDPVPSDEKSSLPSSPPGSPRSRSRITAFTSECGIAASEIENFMKIIHEKALCINDVVSLVLDRPKISARTSSSSDDVRSDLLDAIRDFGNRLSPTTFKDSIIPDSIILKILGASSNNSIQASNFREFCYGISFLCHHSCQIICQRASRSIRCSIIDGPDNGTVLNNIFFSAQAFDQSRLSTSPVSQPDLAQSFRRVPALQVEWESSISAITGASDPLYATLSYCLRTYTRNDGEIGTKVMVSIVIYNVTPVPIQNGIQLHLSVVCSRENGRDGDIFQDASLIKSTNCIFEEELEPGGHLCWETSFESWPKQEMELCTSITLLKLEKEKRTHSFLNLSTKDETSSKFHEVLAQGIDDEDSTIDINFDCEPRRVNPMLILHPHPLAFSTSGQGNLNAFAFLSLAMPFRMPALKLTTNEDDSHFEREQVLSTGNMKAELVLSFFSSITLKSGGEAEGWAFTTLDGKQLLIIIENQKAANIKYLMMNGDDKTLLRTFFDCDYSRSQLVCGLLGGAWSVASDQGNNE